jgi:threonylcarbamoyladenosine tRNA methylthiotransferase MtaB
MSVHTNPEIVYASDPRFRGDDNHAFNKDKDIEIVTFGCRLNGYESQVMQGHAAKAGLTDTIIVNTCAVTQEAEKQARQTIRRLGRERPQARIIVTGCAAQINPERFAAMPEVAHVIGNDVKMQAETYAALDETARVRVNAAQNMRDVPLYDVPLPDIPRAFVEVQNGCDHRCTFCIIPYGRGPSRSVPMGEVAARLRELVRQGYKEIVLTGVDITSYGSDLPGTPSLGQMLRRVMALIPEHFRLRLSSLDPKEIDEDIWRLLADEPRFMPHLHLSLQAGDDMVLKRMKRRHDRQDVIDLVQKARGLRPDVVFGADIIAGFPTETDAMFAHTLELVEACDFTWLHVFPYSPREGTPAAKMPQVPVAVRKERAARLRATGEAAQTRLWQRLQGSVQETLIEKNDNGRAHGRTPHYAEVTFASDLPAGSLVPVRMDGKGAGAMVPEERKAA